MDEQPNEEPGEGTAKPKKPWSPRRPARRKGQPKAGAATKKAKPKKTVSRQGQTPIGGLELGGLGLVNDKQGKPKKLRIKRTWKLIDASLMRTAGRPRIIIDWQIVKSMLAYGCEEIDICNTFNVSEQALRKRCISEQGVFFSQLKTAQVARMDHALRSTMLNEALGYTWDKHTIEEATINGELVKKTKKETMYHPPSTPLLIFIGKNRLGMSDEPDSGAQFGQQANYRFVGDDDDEAGTDPLSLSAGSVGSLPEPLTDEELDDPETYASDMVDENGPFDDENGDSDESAGENRVDEIGDLPLDIADDE